ncbi:hypothetical protein [Halothiobacillus diazotrophicus]|uniref:hypothetical protein n=1 Tax=Halothiobacillus diazotrophicus TaxID=1860122 RepID=UPI0018D27A64|nr:hypothetical protein [Halothiobacillus diazotrophicus]
MKKSYILLPGNKGVTKDDLQFQEYAHYVTRGLAAHGFTPAETVANANVAIVLSYGIGDPQSHQYSYSLPVYGQTGIASSNTYGTLSSYGNSSSYSGTTTYTPSYGVTGYTSETGSYTTYYRYAQITAYDFQRYLRTKEQRELWKTTVSSTGSSGDLRLVFPILIAAAAPYIATDTGRKIQVVLEESDPSVAAIELSSTAQK